MTGTGVFEPFDPPDEGDGPIRLIAFYLLLPGCVSMPSGSTFTFHLPDDARQLAGHLMYVSENSEPWESAGTSLVSLRFFQLSVPQLPLGVGDVLFDLINSVTPDLGISKSKPDHTMDDLTTIRTVVEAVTEIEDEANHDELSGAFDRCLEWCHKLSRAYRIALRLPIPLVTYDNSPPAVPWVVREWRKNQLVSVKRGLLMLHFHSPEEFAIPELDEEALNSVGGYLQALSNDFVGLPYIEHRLEARRAITLNGQYGVGVILAYAATEVLFDSVLKLLLWEEGLSARESANRYFKAGLRHRVRTAFHPRVGGQWALNGSSPIGRWAQELAPVRHRVVHAAYVPTRTEALNALALTESVEDFLSARVARSTPFPRTALLLLGKRRLKERGLWSRRFEAIQSAQEEWFPQFELWQKKLTEAIEAL